MQYHLEFCGMTLGCLMSYGLLRTTLFGLAPSRVSRSGSEVFDTDLYDDEQYGGHMVISFRPMVSLYISPKVLPD